MSWFTEIAGKAENLLNAMDQSAANALNTTEKKKSRDKRSHNNDNYNNDNNSNNEDFSESYVLFSFIYFI